jgi:hypothetical protein
MGFIPQFFVLLNFLINLIPFIPVFQGIVQVSSYLGVKFITFLAEDFSLII